MIKFKKLGILVFTVQFAVILALDGVQASGSIGSHPITATPKILIVTQPKAEYNAGEKIYIAVKTPNYGGKVEYRAAICDENNKEIRNLWNTYPYYYKNWQPAGITLFPITWTESTAGMYKLMIFVRSVGSNALYESYTSTDLFRVKGSLPLVSKYSLTLNSDVSIYGVSDLIDTSLMTQAGINSAVENRIKSISPVTIRLSTKVLGKQGYDYVGVIPLDMPDTQLWAKDGNGNWYDINADGIGVKERFSLPADYNSSITFYPIFSDKGKYELTFELIDGNDIDYLIARGTKTFEAKYQRSIYAFYYAASPSGYTTNSLIDTKGKTQDEINTVVGSVVRNITPIYTELFTAQEGMSGYDTARIDALKMDGVQLWVKDGKGNWIDINRDGLGPEKGTKIDYKYDKYIDMYPIFLHPGNRTLNVRVIDVSDGKTITSFKATLNVSDKSCYSILMDDVGELNTKELVDVSGKSREEINQAIESAVSDITPVEIKLLTSIKGSNGYDSARIMPIEVANMQLWAKNSEGNWVDINKSGWGPENGFELPVNYEATTKVYPIVSQPGLYKCNIKLVNLKDNYVIAEDMVEFSAR